LFLDFSRGKRDKSKKFWHSGDQEKEPILAATTFSAASTDVTGFF